MSPSTRRSAIKPLLVDWDIHDLNEHFALYNTVSHVEIPVKALDTTIITGFEAVHSRHSTMRP